MTKVILIIQDPFQSEKKELRKEVVLVIQTYLKNKTHIENPNLVVKAELLDSHQHLPTLLSVLRLKEGRHFLQPPFLLVLLTLQQSFYFQGLSKLLNQ